MAGTTQNPNNNFIADSTLVRYNSNGSLDTTFGDGGKVTTDFDGYNNRASSITLDSNGKILVAGSLYNPNNSFRHNSSSLQFQWQFRHHFW